MCNIDAASWDYDDPSLWDGICTSPQSNRQSPINIVKADVVVDNALCRLQALNYKDDKDGELTISNNGNSLKAVPSFTDISSSKPSLVFDRKFSRPLFIKKSEIIRFIIFKFYSFTTYKCQFLFIKDDPEIILMKITDFFVPNSNFSGSNRNNIFLPGVN